MQTTTKKEFYLTQDGIDKLKAEHDQLVHQERAAVAQSLKTAKEFGDLSENVEWEAAKDRQAYIEGRISEIDHILRHASVIEAPKSHSAVAIGSTVHLEIEDGTQKYTIVGTNEADPQAGRVSDESPIGRALLGKKKGEEVEVSVPSGTMTYKITHIE